MKKKVLTILGTRPEAIKFAPLIKEFEKHSEEFDSRVCSTGQHREMLDQVLDFFDIDPEYKLGVMSDNQTLFGVSAKILVGLEKVFNDFMPDVVFVQGDTATTLFGALGGFYKQVKVAHLEAGLRSGYKLSPFPEEVNRLLVSRVADLHFTATQRNGDDLRKEGIEEGVHEVGNTVVDALFLCLEKIKERGEETYEKFFDFVDFNKRVILVTGHRRESFGKPFEELCRSLGRIKAEHPDVEIVYPVHLNPNVQKPVHDILGGQEGIHLISPLDYPYLVWLMNKCELVLTDSGGIQEEAPSLGKQVLVMRDDTDRKEGVDAGTAILVGTDPDRIYWETTKLLRDADAYGVMAKTANPYGDGGAAQKVVKIIGEL